MGSPLASTSTSSAIQGQDNALQLQPRQSSPSNDLEITPASFSSSPVSSESLHSSSNAQWAKDRFSTSSVWGSKESKSSSSAASLRDLKLTIDKNGARQIHRESGQSILNMKRDVGYTEATNTRGKINHKVAHFVGARTDLQKTTHMIEHVINHPSAKRNHDKWDAGFQQCTAKINDKKVTLSLGVGKDGKIEKAFTFSHELAKQKALKRTLIELKEKNWKIKYGDETRFFPKSRVIHLNGADPKGSIESLVKSLSTFIEKDNRAVEKAVNKVNRYFCDHGPENIRGYYLQLSIDNLAAYGKDDGFYKAVTRMVEDTGGEDIGSIIANKMPGITKADAITIFLYRLMYLPLNETLRAGDRAQKEAVKPLVDLIRNVLRKLESYDGVVYRTIGGRPMFGPVSGKEITELFSKNINKVTIQPAFLSCKKEPGGFAGNVEFVINQKTGKDLGPLSPYAEILLPNECRIIPRKVEYLEGSTEYDEFPKKVLITLDQIVEKKQES